MVVNSCRQGPACWRRSRKAAASLINCVISSRSLAEGDRVSSKRVTASRSAYSASKRWGNAPGSDEGRSWNGEVGVTGDMKSGDTLGDKLRLSPSGSSPSGETYWFRRRIEESLLESEVCVFVLLKELTTEMGPARPAPSARFIEIPAGSSRLVEGPVL